MTIIDVEAVETGGEKPRPARARKPKPDTPADSGPKLGHPVLAVGWDPNTGEWTPHSPVGLMLVAVAAGNHLDVATRYGNLQEQLVARLLAEAEQVTPPGEWDRADIPADHLPLVDLAWQLAKAEATFEVELVMLWRRHSSNDYRAGRDLLARRLPARWKPQQHIAVEGTLTVEIPEQERMRKAFQQRPELAASAEALAIEMDRQTFGHPPLELPPAPPDKPAEKAAEKAGAAKKAPARRRTKAEQLADEAVRDEKAEPQAPPAVRKAMRRRAASVTAPQQPGG